MTITLDITASDVAHSWWIPKLGGKADALPGYVNRTWFKVPLDNLEGRDEVIYTGQCAELCGRNHANMSARVRVLRFDDWKAWYDRKAQAIQAANRAGARQREELNREQQQAAEATSGEESSN
jgi:cytochrome c oxidase subunit 2